MSTRDFVVLGVPWTPRRAGARPDRRGDARQSVGAAGAFPGDDAGGRGGRVRAPDARPLGSRIEQSFLRRIRALPRDSQQLLLTAAAEPVGDATLLWGAAERLGIGTSAAVPAEAAGLVEVGLRVRFRHPLVRSASYKGASLPDRQDVHRALAEATDPEIDPDRRAWHLALAASGPDELVADELERSAERARGRGGVAAAAAFLQRATELTPDAVRRGERALAAAQAKLDAAAPDAASELLATAELCPLDELQRARLERLRARSRSPTDAAATPPRCCSKPPGAWFRSTSNCRVRRTWRRSARRSSPAASALDAGCSRSAAPPSRRRGRVATGDGPAPGWSGDAIHGGLHGRSAPLKRTLQAFLRDDGRHNDYLRWLWLACRVAADLWDDEAWDELTTRQVQLARDAGALTVLPVAFTYRAGVQVHAGEFTAAAALIEEANAISEATGAAPFTYSSLVLAAVARPGGSGTGTDRRQHPRRNRRG